MVAPSDIRRRNPALPLYVGGILVAIMAVGFAALEPVTVGMKVSVGVFLLAFAIILLASARRVQAQWARAIEDKEWFATLLSSIGDAVIATDAAGRITFMNPVAEALTRWKEREARGQLLPKVLQLVDRTTRESLGNCALRVLRDEVAGVLSRSTLLIARDGTELPIADSGAPIRQADGEISGAVIVFRDATEAFSRIAAEERVRHEEDFSNTLINSMPGIFYLFDEGGKLRRWNKNFEKVTEHTAEEIALLSPLELFTPHSRRRARERMIKGFAEGHADVEVTFQTKDGPSPPYYVTGQRIEVDGRRCVLGIGIDISARLNAETALRATMARLGRQNAALSTHTRGAELLEAEFEVALHEITEVAARTLEVSRSSVWFYDEGRTVLRCADLFEKEANRHSSGIEVKAEDFPAYFRALEEERALAAHDAYNDPRTKEWESYLRPLGISAMIDAPIRSRGKLVGVACHEHVGEPRHWAPDEQNFAGSIADLVSLSLEVGHRQRAEAGMRQAHADLERKVAERTRELEEANDQLKELDRLKSEFLATMSHELRTPLNSIIGFTGILKQGLPGPVNPEQGRQLGMVHSSAKHLLGLINDLLDLSRLESGRMDVHIEKFPFAKVVEEVTHMLQPQVEQKKLSLEAQLDDPAAEIECDHKKVFQILLNLANNAVKFTDRGRVRIESHTTPQELTVMVSDTGIGIKAEHMGRLFEAFRQVDGSARRVYEGTGLGLYLCRKLIIMLGGTINAESVFGVGSRFIFTLPRKPPGAVNP